MKSVVRMFCVLWGRSLRVPTARMVSDGSPDPAGIFSGEREARRCWITQRGHIPPSLMAVCHLISALRTTMQCSVEALQLQFIHLLRSTQTPLTSAQKMEDNLTVETQKTFTFSIYIYAEMILWISTVISSIMLSSSNSGWSVILHYLSLQLRCMHVTTK